MGAERRGAELIPQAAPFCGVLASFAEQELWRKAARPLRAAGEAFEAYSPIGDEEALRGLRPHTTQNPVRLWTLLGGMLGGTMAFCMTIWMSRNWPLVVGGKPIVSWPPFICICFEMTVLYGAFACMGSFFGLGRLPHLTLPAAYRAEFSVDHYGLFLPCGPEEEAGLRRRLREAGAERTWAVYNHPRGRLADTEAGPEGEA